ncbi:MAG: hypothetical protein ABIF06_02015 [bacterium]
MKIKEQNKAKELRQKGYSLKEISESLSVSKSSASIWVKDVQLSPTAKQVLLAKYTAGQLASQETKRLQTSEKENKALNSAKEILRKYKGNPSTTKIICALIYYCEGGKRIQDGIQFINSDPALVATFMNLFRSSFDINEQKFRVCVHLHDYHDKDQQLKFWSKVARIPLGQFIKPYLKKNSGLYKKEGYQGCASIRYADVSVAREMVAVATEFMKKGL